MMVSTEWMVDVQTGAGLRCSRCDCCSQPLPIHATWQTSSACGPLLT